MDQPPQPHRPEKSELLLLARGIALIIGAFISAAMILQLHYPSGH
ncbi:MAG: hypothetical protein JWN14_3133 [Chthonomonadales bacterium]|nr:hypothetical protein [Chthonomonadales bacterium]